ncbi:hypothetical protein DVH24_021847 [Malus domestica]|uniref:Obg-like ATPase 1 n=1 Tax=Malus domestica TaxID=3750 RepID=A0A498IWT6_MALDO|nr:hypothetical protein DVH24_021847 [Malus domestica]
MECFFIKNLGAPMARIGLCSQLLPSLLVPLKQRNHQQLMGVIATGFGRRRGFSAGSSSKISMSLKAGIVGLPNVGKSTLFNAVVENGKAQAANFPFCTIEPNVGIVAVPDPRLSVLSDLSKSQRAVPASIELVDIAGLVKGASQGEGLGNKFLSNIRKVDSILQVVRCFEDNDVVHVSGKVDPKADIDVINLELIFSDLDQEETERSTLDKIQNALMDGKPARSVALTDLEKDAVKHLCLLTMKPIIYVANVAESDLAEPELNPHVKEVMNLAPELQSGVVTISAQVESELTELPYEERTEFLESLGVGESGLGNLIRATYSVLGLRTYFTSGEKETKAWTILAGMTAPQAAGVIHSDFEKGFIRAETVAYDDFVAAGSLAAARERGVLRSEGKDYIVQEGDLGRSSSYSSLRSKSTREAILRHENHELHPHHHHQSIIYVGSTRKRYVINSKYLNHPLLDALINKSSKQKRGEEDDIFVNCEVVLFDHLLWMLENNAEDPSFGSTSESLEELAALYVAQIYLRLLSQCQVK